MAVERDAGVAHTPGPWKSWPREDGSLITNAAGTEAVCHLVLEVRAPGRKYPAVMDANARLIAAAPDLLAALKSIVAHMERWRIEETADGDLSRARRAIAKAEGR